MSIFNNNLLAGAAAQGGTTPVHTIDQSIRFNADDSAYLSRTQPTSTTTNKLFTISFWIKRTPGNNDIVYNGAYNSNNFNWLGFASDDTFFVQFYSGGNNIFVQTTDRKFRDPSAWYHIVYIYDSAKDISSERTRFYVNGQRETLVQYSSITLYPSQNGSHYWIYTGVGNYIGLRPSDNYRLDSYIAELAMFQDQGYEPENFGEYNSSNIWIPKNGIADLNFGDSGFYIKGEDSSNLGNDSGTANSGSGYDFTASGLTADDQKSDSPTSNHTTWNPLTTSAQTYSNGNLNAASSSSAWKGGFTTAQVPLNSGTWYYEIYVDSAGASSGQFSIGWSESNRSVSDDNSSGDTEGWVTYAINGSYYANGGSGSLGDTYTTGDVIGCKIDTDSSTNNVEFYKNGASQGTRSQAFNTGGTGFISPYILLYGTRNATARFAQSEWTQTPSGITDANAINTKNLGS